MRIPQPLQALPLAAFLFGACADKERSPTTPIPAHVQSSVVTTTVAGDPLPGLTAEQLSQFEQGKVVFNRVFVPTDGLGPLFNGARCAGCHSSPAVGGVSGAVEVHVAQFQSGTCNDLTHLGGPVIQQRATPALTAAMGILLEPMPGVGAVGRRTSTDAFGFGLMDEIPEATIIALADPNDANRDGISGRVNYTPDGRVGRFGRKATDATLREFNDGAFLQEMGVTTPAHPEDLNIGGQPIPEGVDEAPDPELSDGDAALANAFVRFLAPNPRRPMSPSANVGKGLFVTIGCASCHVPTLRTGPSDVAALSNKDIEAHSDFLLHDMGPDLADICRLDANPGEFRTEPLTGLRLNPKFLHDGRATSVTQAITLHDGEARASRVRFSKLTPYQRSAIMDYLATL
jgi:CxxC motif-containing protein (DUF1111 family)